MINDFPRIVYAYFVDKAKTAGVRGGIFCIFGRDVYKDSANMKTGML